MTSRSALLALALALPACSGPPTVSVLLLRGDGTPELSDLTRLRLIVRRCDSDKPVLAQNIPIDGADTPKLPGALVPGTSFYVWIQGWEHCNPPCIPETELDPDSNVCTCFDGEDPPEQVYRYEACTDWLDTNTDVRRTLTLAPKASPALCPPAPLVGAACKAP